MSNSDDDEEPQQDLSANLRSTNDVYLHPVAVTVDNLDLPCPHPAPKAIQHQLEDYRVP